MLVIGAPGVGKTALVSARMPVHARFLCRSNVTASSEPVRVLADIAGQLARTVPGYCVAGAGLGPAAGGAAQTVLDRWSPWAAYDRALRFPLGALASSGRASGDVLVVIDGLDEATARDGSNPLAELLAERLAPGADATPGLRLLLTARPGPAATRLRGLTSFDLVADASGRVDSVREHIDAVCDLPARQRRAIAAAAGGSHVYAELAGRLVAAGRGAVLAGAPPVGLDALYDMALEDVGEPDTLARRALALLARVRDNGATANQVAALLGEPRARVHAALADCAHLLAGTKWLRLHHRRLAERIEAAHTEAPGAVDWTIASALRRRWDRSSKRRIEPYAARNLLVHLADARDQPAAAARAAAADLSDPLFLTTALAAVGVDDVLCATTHLRRGLPAMPSEAEVAEIILHGQARALRLARAEGDPTLAAQQLLYEAASIGETPLARSLAARLGDSGVLTLWATQDSPLRSRPKAARGHASQVGQIVITPDGTRGISASEGETRVWQLASGRVAQTMETTGKITALYPAPDTSQVVAATADGQAEVLDTERGETVHQLTSSRTTMVTAFAVSSGGTRAVSGDLDGHITIWDLTAGEPDMRLPCRTRMVTAVAITPDGRAAAAALFGGGVVVWDLTTGQPVAELPRWTPVAALALTPAADRLLVGDGSVLEVHALAGPSAGARTDRLITHHRVTALAVNPVMPDYALLGTAFGQVAYVRMSRQAGADGPLAAGK
jgi:hypothetical protein